LEVKTITAASVGMVGKLLYLRPFAVHKINIAFYIIYCNSLYKNFKKTNFAFPVVKAFG
jgi:hypothetical protein